MGREQKWKEGVKEGGGAVLAPFSSRPECENSFSQAGTRTLATQAWYAGKRWLASHRAAEPLSATGEPPSPRATKLSLSATGEPSSRRAAEPLNYIPSSFFKHSVRLASRRAAEPPSRRAAEPLNYIPSSFFKHSIRLASRRAAEPPSH